MSSPHLSQGADQTRVENDQQQQRTDRPEHEVADHLVDDEVRDSVSQLGGSQLDLVPAAAHLPVPDRLLEETRNVVQDGGNDDNGDGGMRPRQGANLASQRHTYGNVAIYSN